MRSRLKTLFVRLLLCWCMGISTWGAFVAVALALHAYGWTASWAMAAATPVAALTLVFVVDRASRDW